MGRSPGGHHRSGWLSAEPHADAREEQDTSGGWTKFEGNPVLGGALGTCFDVAVLKEGDVLRMYFSWRPRKSLALVESRDGIRWSEPRIVLGPNPATGWEDDINRPAVIKEGGGYHLWYTGQARGRSAIGYATSADGLTWTRRSDRPVLAPERPWEKVAVMCPHVIRDERDGNLSDVVHRRRSVRARRDRPRHQPRRPALDADSAEPVFAGDPALDWEHHKVTACQVVEGRRLVRDVLHRLPR